ncbi:hypothetical protein TNCV_3101281 [Trichonephila clavipes]|nr:hypothetical protein TNCV_3101281 [Trichonephila clavipes]
MSKSPDRKRLTELGSPPIPINALWIAKGDCFDISLFEKDNIKNLVLAAIPLTFSPVPSTWPPPPRPHLTSPQVLKVQNPAQVPDFPGSSPLCHHTKSEKNIRHNFIPLSPGLPQDFVAEK